jgi:hypothetical protein
VLDVVRGRAVEVAVAAAGRVPGAEVPELDQADGDRPEAGAVDDPRLQGRVVVVPAVLLQRLGGHPEQLTGLPLAEDPQQGVVVRVEQAGAGQFVPVETGEVRATERSAKICWGEGRGMPVAGSP